MIPLWLTLSNYRPLNRATALALVAQGRLVSLNPERKPPALAATEAAQGAEQAQSGNFTALKRSPLRITLALLGRGFKYLGLAHLAFIMSTSLAIACFAFITPGATTLSLVRKYGDGFKIAKPVPAVLDKTPKRIRAMIVSVEDGHFWTHHGFEIEAFQRAAEVNKRIGKNLYGGSTLTMQLARTLFLVPNKSYLRKYLELIIALELELILSKERIFELYLSWAEWGRGAFGVHAGARIHFKKGIWDLSTDQMARLTALLSSPIRNGPYTLHKNGILRSRYDFLAKKYS